MRGFVKLYCSKKTHEIQPKYRINELVFAKDKSQNTKKAAH